MADGLGLGAPPRQPMDGSGGGDEWTDTVSSILNNNIINNINNNINHTSSATSSGTPCPLSLTTVQLTSVEFILPTLTLGLLNVMVIVGNALVIGAVFTSAKLRTTTNGFVCSLAVADLLVGLMVLPFSNANEVLRYWVFGPIWCSVWLAVDVWLCTASILNLVAISFDRYIAISRPFKYHNLLSPKRGKFLVGFVWVLSFVICFPPLIGWNEQGRGLGNRFGGRVLDSAGIAAGGALLPPFNASDVRNVTNTTARVGWTGTGSGDDSHSGGGGGAAVIDGGSGGGGSGSGSGGGGGGIVRGGVLTGGGEAMSLGLEAMELGVEAGTEGLYIVSEVKRYAAENLTLWYGGNSSRHPGIGGGLTGAGAEGGGGGTVAACDLRFPECGLTSDPGYIVYSALGSFWIPMIIMCAFYWKIYRTAVKSTAALKHGMLITKAGTDLSSSGNPESVTLRIHRGGGGGAGLGCGGGGGVGRGSENGSKKRSGTLNTYPKCHYRSSYMGRNSVLADAADTVFVNAVHATGNSSRGGGGDGDDCYNNSSSSARNKRYRDPGSTGQNSGKHNNVRLSSTMGPQPDFPLLGKYPDDTGDYSKIRFKQRKRSKSGGRRSRSGLESRAGQAIMADSLTDTEEQREEESLANGGLSPVDEPHETKAIAFLRKSRRKNIKLELQRLNKEKKAAKTVGVIVGCFVLCWLPFFTVYLLGAFCPSCTPPLVFSIFFWLGYCNSAINPCVYALFSRDFRCAFKKLLRCNCRIEPRYSKQQKQQQLGFVSKLHSFRMQASLHSNESNSD